MTSTITGRAKDVSADFYVDDVPDYIPMPTDRIPVNDEPFDLGDRRRGREGSSGPGSSSGAPRWQKRPSSGGGADKDKPVPADLDEHRLAQRQKQIDYGKNTIGYQRYLKEVPKDKRRRRGDQCLDAVTPDINQNISKRCFDGQVRVWRRFLHKYDTELEEGEERKVPNAYAPRGWTGRSSDDVAVSAVASSPTNSSRSRGSLDGYLEPSHARAAPPDGGRKRPFGRAFDGAPGNPNPSKLLTSPAAGKPLAPQSAPPATAADSRPAPSPAGRCADPPCDPPLPMTAPPAASRSAAAAAATSTADPPRIPPHAALSPARGPGRSGPSGPSPYKSRLGGSAAGVGASPPGSAGRRGTRPSPMKVAGGGEDLFREWEEEDYEGLEPCDDAELEEVGL
ncbi:hypothetical protein HYH03_001511 [Edaphochlamys debaryana]|uniref:Histone RNA hairpin-binding protein RNA-binding domain-containing protein n=1 Tax=Edaphochlamys debaryana TaxID=47281 RepID=A0A835YD42_9CHLO|nr:hypothetical protein HYH03_001511 [Edaphochlamys debaryana]|eukprot:KAG2500747.1 hypothetical protein HYH03_001511 [Edaphochlamys debaryana]